jgi:hypothetical protein
MSPRVGVCILVVVVCAAVPVPWGMRLAADDKPAPSTRKAALTHADFDWVDGRHENLTEAELTARFGPPDEFRSPGRAIADYALVWRDRTVIRVRFVGGKSEEFSGVFSERLPHKRATQEAFRKLRIGQSVDETEEVLGQSSYDDADTNTSYWGESRTLIVFLKAGKLAGHGWNTNLADRGGPSPFR